MEILADQDITAVAEAFAGIGELRLFEGRSLRAHDLGRAEILLVRSVTRVDAALIHGSRLRFVGTATAGTDHIDCADLSRRGIVFADAAGCNARGVAEHVLTCIYSHAAASGRKPAELSVGVVGWGHVGRALTTLLERLGIAFSVSDPPLAAEGRLAAPATLAEVLRCDVVSLHVPLTVDGKHPTLGLIDAERIAALKPGALLINAARGGVIDEAALVARLRDGPPLVAAIDCWLDEPAIDGELLRLATFATPHIAGHTLEARLSATALLHAATMRFLGRAPSWVGAAPPVAATLGPAATVALLDAVHPLRAQSARLRRMLALPAARRGAHFDDVRRRYGLRREFAAYSVASAGLAPDTVAELGALGFQAALPS